MAVFDVFESRFPVLTSPASKNRTSLITHHEPGARFSEVPKNSFVNLRSTNSVKLVFSYIVKEIKIEITAKFRASRRFRALSF